MANVKISDLPAATSVDPFDTFVMVQSGVTKQASQANILTTTGNVTAAKFFPTGTSATGTGMYSAAANTLAWSNNGAETMRLDSSGNLGLGVTPSAWSGFKAIDVGATASFAGTSNGPYTTQNGYWNGSAWIYKTTAVAGQYLIAGNSHQWYTAPSGTAGAAISFTQAMTLDASGNLGIGTSSPGAKFQVGDAGSAAPIKILIRTASADTYLQSTTTGSEVGTPNGVPLLFKTNDAERMRLDASGNLGIGTTSTSGIRLGVDSGSAALVANFNSTNANGGYIRFQNSGTAIGDIGSGANIVGGGKPASDFGINVRGANNLLFGTNDTERARITSGGDLLVGDTTQPTSADNRLAVIGTRGIDCKNTGGATAPNITAWNNATTGDNIFVSFRTETTDTARGSISYNRAGGLVAYNTTSDYRAKDILGPVANPGATIDALKVYEGQMKGATQPRPMLVAHEAQTVAPYSVTGEKDEVNDNGDPVFQQMDVSSLVPLLIAEIQSLRARVAALEA